MDGPPPWSHGMGPSIGCARPSSILPAYSRRLSTPAAADASRWSLEIEAEVKRRYLPDTNVLETTFTTRVGVVRVTDVMALPDAELGPTRELIRRVDGLQVRVPMRWRITLAFGYGTRTPRLESRGGTPVATDGPDALAVCSWDAGEAHIDEEAIFGRFEVREWAARR